MFGLIQHVIPLQSITSIEKKVVAGVFQNAIEICCNDAKYFFGSFYQRELTYEMLTRLTSSHPNNTVCLKELPDGSVLFEPEPQTLLNFITNDLSALISPVTTTAAIPIDLSTARHPSEGSVQSLHRSRSLGSSDLRTTTLKLNGHEDLGLAGSLTREFKPEVSVNNRADSSHIVHQKIVAHVAKGDHVLDRPLIPQNPKNVKQTSKKPVHVYEGDPPFPPGKGSTIFSDLEYPLTVAELWEQMFGYESASTGFSRYFWEVNQKFVEIEHSDWVETLEFSSQDFRVPQNGPVTHENARTGLKRRVQYMVPISNPLTSFKSTICIVRQEIIGKGRGFIATRVLNETPNIPTGDTFRANMLLTMTQVSESKSRMTISCVVDFVKPTWMKSTFLH